MIKATGARIKPYEILRKIARRFGFGLGVPRHSFKESEIETGVDMSFHGKTLPAICSVSCSRYYDCGAYFYQYVGPVLDNEKLKIADYSCFVVGGFHGCRGFEKLMVVRKALERKLKCNVPEWFPDRI